MGRKTWDSLPGPLPGRRHIVLTTDTDWSAPGAEPAHYFEDALRMAGDEQVWVIGGRAIYELALPWADRLYITCVATYVDGDTKSPRIDQLLRNWPAVGSSRKLTSATGLEYRFWVHERAAHNPADGV